MKSKKIWLLLVPVLILVVVGGFMLKQKTEEEKRNREYEVSLVKALKNSYAGIEEIKITNPYYTDKPGSWSCKIEIHFSDKRVISYGTNHDLDENVNYDGRMTYGQRDFLNNRKGQTTNKVKVTYSDREKGEQ